MMSATGDKQFNSTSSYLETFSSLRNLRQIPSLTTDWTHCDAKKNVEKRRNREERRLFAFLEASGLFALGPIESNLI